MASDSNLLYYIGMTISHSMLHDSFSLPGISQAVVAHMLTGSMDEAVPLVTAEDIPDLEIRETVSKVKVIKLSLRFQI